MCLCKKFCVFFNLQKVFNFRDHLYVRTCTGILVFYHNHSVLRSYVRTVQKPYKKKQKYEITCTYNTINIVEILHQIFVECSRDLCSN